MTNSQYIFGKFMKFFFSLWN